MSTRRHLILDELGLMPLWRTRQKGCEAEPVPEQEPVPATVTGTATSRITVSEDDRRSQVMQMDWASLRKAVTDCTACPLHATRTTTVFGTGDEQADWLCVGEAPGADEDIAGEPFVGQAGKLLDNLLAAIRLKRGQNVYIANVVKCRPPGNRNPDANEMAQCESYLARQISLIRPRLILALGKVAAQHLLQTEATIASLRGKVHDYAGIPVIVTYHPAYLLRTLPDKAKAWEDLCFAIRTMESLLKSAD